MSFKDKDQKKKLNKGKYKKDSKVVPISKHRGAGNHKGNKDEDGIYAEEIYQEESTDALATGLIVGLEMAAQIADDSTSVDNSSYDNGSNDDGNSGDFGGFDGGTSDGGGASSDY